MKKGGEKVDLNDPKLVRVNRRLAYDANPDNVQLIFHEDEQDLFVTIPYWPREETYAEDADVEIGIEPKTLRIVHVHIWDYPLRFAEDPVLRKLFERYQKARSERKKQEYAARIFHALAWLAVPKLRPYINWAYRKAAWEAKRTRRSSEKS